ncbi:MAG: DUF3108 domain-containing protein [Gammaproteobacteria bacterium]|nr:MAG: DUF3108 domain-containing protein [Gammaproteobacteria bacterium]
MRTFIFCLIAGALSLGAHANAVLKPMSATYSVVRDGKTVGDATYTLASNPDGTWTLRSETHGTAGIARLAGLDVREESTFRWQDGRIDGVSYDYRQDATFKHKQRRIDFEHGEAHVQEGKDHFDYAVQPGTMDRSSVALALGQTLATGRREATLPVAVRDRVEQQHFVVAGEETISVPAGSFKAVRFERTDQPGKIRSWYAANVSTLPLRVEQKQNDGSVIVLELKR